MAGIKISAYEVQIFMQQTLIAISRKTLCTEIMKITESYFNVKNIVRKVAEN